MLKRYFILFFIIVSCTKDEKEVIPHYITFKTVNDSIFVELKNSLTCNSFLKITDKTKDQIKILDFNKPDTLTILKFHKSEIDSSEITNNYKFKLHYGQSNFKTYDSLYNYGLPFSKGKRYRILQQQNGSFSHFGSVSRYALDFKMKIGQEVCAIREGIVVYIKNDSDIGGNNKKYKPNANNIIISHNDGTFSQYAHFKKNGIIVKKGDTLKKGQLIGYSGNTGYSSKPHLHFAVYKPTLDGLNSIPYILDSIPSQKYKTGLIATNK